jgi:hypothetical protein
VDVARKHKRHVGGADQVKQRGNIPRNGHLVVHDRVMAGKNHLLARMRPYGRIQPYYLRSGNSATVGKAADVPFQTCGHLTASKKVQDLFCVIRM